MPKVDTSFGSLASAAQLPSRLAESFCSADSRNSAGAAEFPQLPASLATNGGFEPPRGENPTLRLAGPAFTVWTRPGDNQGIHRALQLARAGDVIVVAGGGDESRALLGELIGERAINLGLAGFALDGAARDAEALREIGMPVFARAITPAGPYKNGPSRLGTPISFGGIPVLPGDIIIGDSDGVVVIPRGQAIAVAEAAEAVFDDETTRRAAIIADRH